MWQFVRNFLDDTKEIIWSFLLNVNISNALDPLSLQDYVALRKVMIKLEYQRMLLLLREEEQLHLEALEREAKEICEQLKESVFRMFKKLALFS